MATAVKQLGFSALRRTCRTIPQRSPRRRITPFRSFTTTTVYRYEDEDEDRPSPPLSFYDSLHPDDRIFYDSLSPSDRQEFERNARELEAHMTSPGVESGLHAEVSNAAHEVATEMFEPDYVDRKPNNGLLAMGETDEIEQAEDPVWKNDDITSLAHGELEQHRELRHYARIAAWEMPLLSSASPTPYPPPPRHPSIHPSIHLPS